MNRDLFLRWTLRAVAIYIAIAAVIDPAITSNHDAHPVVAIIAAPHDSALAAHVSRALGGGFAIVPGPFAAADAAVLVDEQPPVDADGIPALAFAVTPDSGGPELTIERIESPRAAPLDARTTITVTASALHARERKVEFTLRAGDGVALDRMSTTVGSDSASLAATLNYVPAIAGAALLDVTARFSDGGTVVHADRAIDVESVPWPVLFFDPRPSWQSTFVRRAVADDDRFVVASRVVTSRGISTDIGQPPGRLDDLALVGHYRAVIVGAPEALTPADVAGLDVFMRRRGGSVILLLDQYAHGPYEGLAAATAWTQDSTAAPVRIAPAAADSGTLDATQFAWPDPLPAGATVLATASARHDSTQRHPVIWASNVGAGHLVVSGAFDAWRYRDPSQSAFNAFWRATLARMASASLPPVDIELSPAVALPGEGVTVDVTLRDAALQWATSAVALSTPVHATVTARLERAGGSDSVVPVRLWPGNSAGEFVGRVAAPATPGSWRVAVSGEGASGTAPLMVAQNVSHPAPNDRAALAAWVAARGGRVMPIAQIASLRAAIRGAIHPASRRVEWHPMRSPWWILPFALALGGEWWLRRRRGLA